MFKIKEIKLVLIELPFSKKKYPWALMTLHDVRAFAQFTIEGPFWSWFYGSWIYNYLCNQCLSPLMLWVRIPIRWDVLDTTLCNKVCQWLAAGEWFSPATPVSSTVKIARHEITEILLKVALKTLTLTLNLQSC